MRQPLRRIENTAISVITLLVYAALGLVSLLILILMLALGF